ncbi:hypothetical protein G6F46_006435 [Rhizopus delemar]|uniref:peptide chain release factor N(5)-glutamine methyltransferase n=2 Tax=Rhizopus TaxID=4842 RepID=A0A9P6Z3S1_9FUNG|nr:hypothetical protein G6F55_009675 [Rhizopus delemar]KAG1543727.1 hypothetical protein G6F51_006501 [Rhizopus arrhizus]KAG1561628.1 hypothetical protein G6F49_001641 [Rhizopus delemar]KAG1569725.1 hypothetical protein G6F50_006118 [Rhizopus delemar]KAG1587409.1 hypothetical protein G6F48_005945 [Rhizopus delemar]
MENEHHVKVIVPESAQDERIRKFISQNYRHIIKSKESIHRAFTRREITINGNPAEETRRLKAGDVVEIKYDKSIEEAERLQSIPIEVLYHDEYLAIVWKPSGQNTIVFEKAIYYNIAEKDSNGNKQKVWCINEVQKAASGLILVAKSEQLKQLLLNSYTNNMIDIVMRVICHGHISTTDIPTLFHKKTQEESIDPNRILKSIEIISHTRSNNAQYITTLDLHLHSPLSSIQLRKLFYFHSDHPIVGESAFTRALHVNKDKGLYASLLQMNFQHPISHVPIHVTAEEPSKFHGIRERELKFYNKKLKRETEAMKRAGVEERNAGELLAYVLGQKEFCNLTYKVTKDCLIPRAASETLVEAAIKVIGDKKEVKIMDVGTGCGNLIVSIMAKSPVDANVMGVGLDISDAALSVAKENGKMILGEEGNKRIEWRNQSMTDISDEKVFDILVCNPPYLDYNQTSKRKVQMADLCQEPHMALFAEEAGFQWYTVLSKIAPQIVKEDGRVILECGKGMLQQVLDIWIDWEQEHVYKDIQGWDRCVVLKKKTTA